MKPNLKTDIELDTKPIFFFPKPLRLCSSIIVVVVYAIFIHCQGWFRWWEVSESGIVCTSLFGIAHCGMFHIHDVIPILLPFWMYHFITFSSVRQEERTGDS